ncbi:MAG TPA: adenylate/guanylate cyclase domain-containing protein [Leptospiraceae bacterium]|nr:adenylate/guanylate cyclase domain-containing protein [Leptospiraceae bacterium]HMY65138.1 adenylate/guanylate cyclase domain-containing protein [Leptospiraceae bacterium]HMZ57217.1 adenylate/guanylate cyclase domain-containing protein [Leptospiraceae bacterium]HNF12504.1 adenylate/guanylate cyclase domain-containing protein [Leptospiraceae bacterium]HNF23122.1 adenylate/guanylate cyclase domain-containing protein [Leptospiraceae bacterium]
MLDLNEEKKLSQKKKSVYPNLGRALINGCIFYFISSDQLNFFYAPALLTLIFSVIWMGAERKFYFNYSRYKFLPYIPAFMDILSGGILIYITGNVNSWAIMGYIIMGAISAFYSSDTNQPLFIMISSVIVYSFICIAVLTGLAPPINILNPGADRITWMSFIMALFFFSVGQYFLYNAISVITKENQRLLDIVEKEQKENEKLLQNILPVSVSEELKSFGKASPTEFESASVLFTDFVGFTSIAEKMNPAELIAELDICFSFFDQVCKKYNLEKLKTIGDSYMCVGGVPIENSTHSEDAVYAALEIQRFMKEMKTERERSGRKFWEIRIGIHSGPLVAGIIGSTKFSYDIWGSTVNIASRMESSGTAGRINVSEAVKKLTENKFLFEHRGRIKTKESEFEMYYVLGIRNGHLITN